MENEKECPRCHALFDGEEKICKECIKELSWIISIPEEQVLDNSEAKERIKQYEELSSGEKEHRNKLGRGSHSPPHTHS